MICKSPIFIYFKLRNTANISADKMKLALAHDKEMLFGYLFYKVFILLFYKIERYQSCSIGVLNALVCYSNV